MVTTWVNPDYVAAETGGDPAGSAAAVQTNLTTHTGQTGTAVHGLGSAATHASTDFAASSHAHAGAYDPAGSAAAVTLAGLGGVPTSRTVAGHALSGDVAVSKADVGLGNVENTALSTWAGSAYLTLVGLLANLAVSAPVCTAAHVAAAPVIPAGHNALSAGPVTIDDGVTVTIPDDSTWSVA